MPGGSDNPIIRTVEKQARVALFVDGENCSHALAPDILAHANSLGEVVARCVVGDVTRLSSWNKMAGFRSLHTSKAKNSADIRLVIEALEFAFAERADTFVIAGSDGGYVHLATYLRERGLTVVGIGEAAKVTECLTASYSHFQIVGKPAAAEAPKAKIGAAAATSRSKTVDEAIRAFLKSLTANDGWITFQKFGSRLNAEHRITRKATGCANWANYFQKHTGHFEVSGKGPSLQVRYRKS